MTTQNHEPLPIARVLLAVLVMLTVVLLPAALMKEYGRGDASLRARFLAFGFIFATGLVGFAVAGIRSARRKRAVTAALSASAQVRIPVTRIRMTVFALGMLLVAAGSLVETIDPTVPAQPSL